MQSFQDLSEIFSTHFNTEHFPSEPSTLYDPNRYFLKLGGKRVRPVLCLMAQELFADINEDGLQLASAVELFHNFSLIHDDIMDQAPLRRGKATVHEKFGANTAILAGDVMLVAAYECLNRISSKLSRQVLKIFNTTAREVCEGQQLDMDFESKESVGFDSYLNMINLKTSVLLAASLKMGALLGGALERNQNLLFEFGRNLGLAFQVQDDYLDAFGDPEKFGKQVGGDIRSNKKTFLLIRAYEAGTEDQRKNLDQLIASNPEDKVEKVLEIYKSSKVDQWANSLKEGFLKEAIKNLDDVAVLSSRKQPLRELAEMLIQREH